LLALPVCGAEFSLAVRNGTFARTNAVVSLTVTRGWAAEVQTHTLVERAEDGRDVPVPCVVDASGGTPVLCWLMPGVTAPDAARRFAWVAAAEAAVPAGDLRLTADASTVAVENGFFSLKHPVQGKGGFPSDIAYAQSGRADPELYFLDRIVRRDEEGRLRQYCACECEDACTRVVFQSPLRVVVETRTGFGRRGTDTPGNPRATYRYIYTAFSPVVEVSARYFREDDGPWRELHFLHLSRKEPRYVRFVTGDNGESVAIQPKGAKSRAVTAAQWAVMEDAADACGAGFDGAVCWDASNEFVYYIRSGHMTWEGPAARFDGGLYFGPALGASWYAQWMGRERQPEIRVCRDGRPWVPLEREPLEGAYGLENRALRIAFAPAEKGFDCLGIENRLAGEETRFVHARDESPGLWSLVFKAPPDADGKQETVELTNRSPAARRSAKQARRGLAFEWQGLDLPGEPGAVDVCAEVRLEAGEGASAWRIRVTNRSRRFGLWETGYPLLCGVTPPGAGDALLPHGNWGGRLMRQYRGRFDAPYPSASCPLQMMAFNLGEAGLYLAAHDGASRTKRLSVTKAQDAGFYLLAEQAGVPGAAGAPDYPVVVAAYRGDWWQAARRYRTWATRQAWTAKGLIQQRADYPRRLEDLGFWMLLGGEAEAVAKKMGETARLFADMPVGVHWYNWHQIPFDHSYPEYFPTKEGMAEATRAMAAAGQTVMPYINARLWDEEIPGFAGAFPAAAKQVTGTNYVEVYGSKRRLVPMCPATPLWQAKVQEICRRLMTECGVNGIYLDQVGAAKPAPCYDASHGHPLGGGRHWTDGYRAMLTPVKREAARRGVVLTTENTAEPYMDTIDAYLAWNPREQEDVPLLPAVYSGYTVYFTSPQAANDSLDAFCAAQARDFLWGCQLGWNGEWILHESHREKQRFQHALCRYRLAAKAFMVCGQLVDEVRPLNEVPLVTHLWHRTKPHAARLPAVMGTVWRDGRAERLAVFVVNTTGETQAFDFEIQPERWLDARGPWRLSSFTPEGEIPIELAQDRRVPLGDLQPREIRAFVIESSLRQQDLAP
jgi:hypothetical protein